MSATAHDVADNAQTAASRANQADLSAKDGEAIVEKTTASIAQLTEKWVAWSTPSMNWLLTAIISSQY
ncbi:hypothetical protein [Marinomonas hwangdonensis]|uniref:hypothetical protein n=1 Tax=Marinomonas hwangdonensis TaxID=1053647 RepID=UPI0011CE5F80|nr:hypothetical protein [Marinomonas hwangdonensis]